MHGDLNFIFFSKLWSHCDTSIIGYPHNEIITNPSTATQSFRHSKKKSTLTIGIILWDMFHISIPCSTKGGSGDSGISSYYANKKLYIIYSPLGDELQFTVTVWRCTRLSATSSWHRVVPVLFADQMHMEIV